MSDEPKKTESEEPPDGGDEWMKQREIRKNYTPDKSGNRNRERDEESDE